ncbi:MAG: LptA/OstA family protein [Novosphingobium sp.]
MAKRTLKSLIWRAGFAGFAGGAALVAMQHATAQGIGAHNTGAPVNYAADRIELQDKQKRVVLSGNVDISQGDLRLHAGRTTVAYTDDGGLKIQRMDATGGVLVTRGGETARGDVAVYDFNRRVIVLAGGVALRRGGDTLNGGRLTIDLNSGISSVDGRGAGSSPALGGTSGGSGGRVTGSFSVPTRN